MVGKKVYGGSKEKVALQVEIAINEDIVNIANFFLQVFMKLVL